MFIDTWHYFKWFGSTKFQSFFFFYIWLFALFFFWNIELLIVVCYRWSYVHGFVLGKVLSGCLQKGNVGDSIRRSVLQIWQSDVDVVHIVAVSCGFDIIDLCSIDNQAFWEACYDALRRSSFLRRCTRQWLRSKGLDAHCWSPSSWFRHWMCQSGIYISLNFHTKTTWFWCVI